MKKKLKTKSKITEGLPEPEGFPKVCKKVEKLDLDFGRGDLNLLRDKLNELIECQ